MGFQGFYCWLLLLRLIMETRTLNNLDSLSA
jgi:hypothetical protein